MLECLDEWSMQWGRAGGNGYVRSTGAGVNLVFRVRGIFRCALAAAQSWLWQSVRIPSQRIIGYQPRVLREARLNGWDEDDPRRLEEIVRARAHPGTCMPVRAVLQHFTVLLS